MSHFFNTSLFVLAFWSIFPIVNPLGALPSFLAMTARDELAKRRQIALKAAIISGSVIFFCCLVGQGVLKFFGFSIDALRIGGGILLLMVSVDMVNVRTSRTKSTTEEQEEGAAKDDIATFPLAIPLLSGPGSIATSLILSEQIHTFADVVAMACCVLVTAAIVWALLREAHRVTYFLGRIGMSVLSRLMGLVLAAKAVQFIVNGLTSLFPRWVS